jgi:hypothetical protein
VSNDDLVCDACRNTGSWVAWDGSTKSFRCINCVGLPLEEARKKAEELRERMDKFFAARNVKP